MHFITVTPPSGTFQPCGGVVGAGGRGCIEKSSFRHAREKQRIKKVWPVPLYIYIDIYIYDQ